MAAFPLQSTFRVLPTAFRDAMMLDLAVEQMLADLRTRRRQKSGTGAGRPPKVHHSLNRAVVAAAVGGLEAYMEQLALDAVDSVQPLPPGASQWYTIAGSRGEIQTPSPFNVRRMFWNHFHVDLQGCWELSVVTSAAEDGGNDNWRVKSKVYKAADAAEFLDATVSIRHSFAHMEPKKKAVAGMANLSKNQKATVSSHHAYNAVSGLIQCCIQSTLFLATSLGMQGTPRWPADWSELPDVGDWLAGTPVADVIRDTWLNAPSSLGEDPETVDDVLSPQV